MCTVELWKKAILFEDATLQEAINNLNASSFQIAMIVSQQGIFLGTLTDGDIRRGILDGIRLDDNVTKIIHRNALVVSSEIPRETVLQLMIFNKIRQIPIIDDHHRVVGLHLWDTISTPPTRPNTMVIMAGGAGVRLRPHTENCPKPLLPVGGKPMLEHILLRAKQEGFSHFVLAIKYLGHMIEEYFGTGERWQVKIEYIKEQSSLGTAGALALLDPNPDSPFIVTNGDILTDIRYGELLDFHVRHCAMGTMAVRTYEWQNPFGVVQTQGIDIVGFEEKPIIRSYINAGIYALSPEALKLLNTNIHCDMPSLFERLRIINARTVAFPMHEPWLDVGRPDDLIQAHLKSRQIS